MQIFLQGFYKEINAQKHLKLRRLTATYQFATLLHRRGICLHFTVDFTVDFTLHFSLQLRFNGKVYAIPHRWNKEETHNTWPALKTSQESYSQPSLTMFYHTFHCICECIYQFESSFRYISDAL